MLTTAAYLPIFAFHWHLESLKRTTINRYVSNNGD